MAWTSQKANLRSHADPGTDLQKTRLSVRTQMLCPQVVEISAPAKRCTVLRILKFA